MKSTLLHHVPRQSSAEAAIRPVQHLPAGDAAGVVKRGRLDLRHLWHSFLEKLWIVVLCVLAGLFLGLGYLARTPKMYQGHIVLEVGMQDTTPMQDNELSSRVRTMYLATQEAMRTIEQNLVNRTLLARVVRAENLTENGGKAILGDKALPLEDRDSAPAASKQASPSDSVGAAPSFTPLEEGLAALLSKSIKPAIRRGTRLIDVYVTNRDPVIAQRLAEAVGREYIRNSVERRASTSQDTLRYLLEEEERLKKNLQKSEAAVAEYKAKTPDALQLGGGAAATGSQQGAGSTASRGGLVEDKLQDLNAKLTTAKADRLRLEGELKQIDAAGDNVDALLAFPSIAAAPTVADRRKDVAQVQAAVAALSQRYKEKHPKMLAARAALNEAQANLRRAVLGQPAVLRNTLEQARAAENNLGAAVHEQEKSAIALNRAAIGYQELARQAETDRALYESVLRQIKETDLSKDVKTNAVSIVEHSPLPRKPVSPSPVKAIGLGLLLGLLAGTGIVYLTDAMDRSVKTVDEAEALFSLPVLAAVPEVKKKETSAAGGAKADEEATYRLVAEAPEGPAAEAFRNLRAAVALLGPEIDHKVFIFTSASPAEGKSFTSANYALSLAQQGYDVLLIDGDLRRPTLHRIFQAGGIEGPKAITDGHGIVDCLVGAVDLTEAVRPVSSSRIDVVPALNGELSPDATQKGTLSLLAGGRRAPNPAELLSGSTFARLIEEATRTYDRVVIDSAPVLAVSDTLLMVPHVQNVCVVIRAGHSARNAIQRSLRLLNSSGGRTVGIVLNRLPRQRGASYYYYYASEGYGAGEGSYSNHYRPRVVEKPSRRAEKAATLKK